MTETRRTAGTPHTYHPGEEERALERFIFSRQPLLLVLFLLATLFFAYKITALRPPPP